MAKTRGTNKKQIMKTKNANKKPVPKTKKRKAANIVPEEWIIESILKHRLNKKTLKAEFFVKWKGFPSSGNTWEPVDHVYHCLELLLEYEKKKEAKLKSDSKGHLSESAISQLPLFKVLSSDILNKLKDPQEYIPRGNEIIANMVSEVTSEAGVPLWNVVFEGDIFPRAVRKAVMVYYWPIESSLFLAKWVSRIQAFQHFEAQEN